MINSLFYISDQTLENGTALIKFDGALNKDNISALKSTLEHHNKKARSICLSFKKLQSIDNIAKEFLLTIKDKINIIDAPIFLSIELGLIKENNNKDLL